MFTGLNSEEKQIKILREKQKGNEAYRAGDLEEAVAYFNRSISISPTVNAINNRAQALIKLKRFNQAMVDCEYVLQLQPLNFKGSKQVSSSEGQLQSCPFAANLRSGTICAGKGHFAAAAQRFRQGLEISPESQMASRMLEEVSSKISIENWAIPGTRRGSTGPMIALLEN